MADFSGKHPNPCRFKIMFIIGNLVFAGIGCFSLLQGLYTTELGSGCSAIVFGVLKIILGLFGCVVILVDKCKDFKTLYRCGMSVAVVWLLIKLNYQVSRYEIKLSTKKIEFNLMLMGYKDNKYYKKFWDETQISFQCCGIDSYKDWEYKEFAMIPDSCCSQKEKCISTPVQISSIYDEGCFKKIAHRIRNDFFLFYGAAYVVLGYTFWMIYISYLVERAKRRHDEEMELVNFATSFGVALPLTSDLREKEEDNLEADIEDENNDVCIYNIPVDVEVKRTV